MIYLDNAATTRPLEGAVGKAAKYLKEEYFNPSARYHGGAEVSRMLARARSFLLERIADPALFELEFTSCGTEADNQAIFSAARRGNAVASAGEHAAVFESFKSLKSRGIEPRFAPVKADGSVDADALVELVDDKTTLVAVVHVNNETGAVNDIAAIAKRVKQKNPRTVFLSDGVQAFGKLPVRLTRDVDFYSVSAHKIGGLKGTGALIRRKACTAFAPYIIGGGQENGMRSGTENTFGIACFYHAAEEKFTSLREDGERLRSYRERLWELLDHDIFMRISPENGTPYILTVSAKGLRGEILQRDLWDNGVAVGTGSACSSKKPFSRVIEACGYDEAALYGVLRMSFSPATTEEETEKAAQIINACARRRI